jgi:2,4-diketo-3-deoxy-L-fuconate hydrolase
MKLCRFDHDHLGLLDGDQVVDVSACLAQLPAHRWPLPSGDPVIANLPVLLPEIEKIASTAPRLALSDLHLEPPIANPGKIIGAPVNYRAHMAEANLDVDLNQGGKVMAIDVVGLFLKANSALAGPSDVLTICQPDRRTDHEGEIVVVIGKTGANVEKDRAMDMVAGFTLGLDMTLRGKEDRSFRKSCDGYAVMGPCFVTPDEISDPAAIALTTRVNGEVRQQGTTAQLIRSIPELIAWASRFYTLHPGDLIMTGTPAGVAPVAPGDVIEVTSPDIGSLVVSVG